MGPRPMPTDKILGPYPARTHELTGPSQKCSNENPADSSIYHEQPLIPAASTTLASPVSEYITKPLLLASTKPASAHPRDSSNSVQEPSWATVKYQSSLDPGPPFQRPTISAGGLGTCTPVRSGGVGGSGVDGCCGAVAVGVCVAVGVRVGSDVLVGAGVRLGEGVGFGV